MRGLLQKDLCLLLQRSRVLIIMIGIGVLMGISTDGSFVIGYLTMICAILTVGTISYDEFDNGYPFLMTLPITKRTYVTGKYLFCLLGGLVGWCVSVVIFLCCVMIKGNTIVASNLLETIAFLPVLALIIAIMLPLQLKYGAEKSRIALAAVVGVVWVLGYLLMNYLPDTMRMPAFVSRLSDSTLFVLLLLFCLAALAVSFLVSLRVMEKKEL
ncbi:MAG: ABC-2 transporter permease [Oscillospiraceae bacterium]|nr:ABC-2 transporter permease [Oscillospiraceae bacterium]